MKVHIVTTDATSDWVCARLARHLMGAFGWSAGRRPRKDADANLYMPYLEFAKQEHPGTATAGWFTHRDDPRPEKVAMWGQAAAGMDLRVTPAHLYLQGLAACGAAAHIPHPVELDKFVIAPRQKRSRPLIGLSGMVYPGGRKGENLVRRLSEKHLDWDIEASGSGWSVKSVFWPWEQMQEHYQRLDVFLCTSTIEGGPVTMLEALACGIPVVVPRGVGQVDELPDVVGVYKYRCGDYGDMERAIQSALDTEHDPLSLRDIVSEYTPERYALAWYSAIEGITASRDWIQQDARPDWRGRAGVYVVAYGDNARDCAKLCIESVHEHMPGLPVALASDRTLGTEDVLVNAPDLDIGARTIKTQIYDRAPQEWEYVLYLDADCQLEAPVPFLFDALVDGWELLICASPDKYHIARNMIRPDNLDECEYTYDKVGGEEVIQYQGGVFSFRRSDRTAAFFRKWHEEWQRYGKRDQGALLRTVYELPIRIYLLGTSWNRSSRYPEDTPCLILHNQMTARRHEGIISGRADSAEAWAAVERFKNKHG